MRQPKPDFSDLDHLPHMLKIPEVASLLSISEFQVRKAAREGTIKSFRWGKSVRIPSTVVKAILQPELLAAIGRGQEILEEPVNGEDQPQSGVGGWSSNSRARI